MSSLQVLPAAGMFVVETYDGRAFHGEVERHGRTVTVYSGLAGRPPVLDEDEGALITAAAEHPDGTALRWRPRHARLRRQRRSVRRRRAGLRRRWSGRRRRVLTAEARKAVT